MVEVSDFQGPMSPPFARPREARFCVDRSPPLTEEQHVCYRSVTGDCYRSVTSASRAMAEQIFNHCSETSELRFTRAARAHRFDGARPFPPHGIRGIGVETIAEAAGTNKMTLYRHFSSKDDLICECLANWPADIRSILGAHANSLSRRPLAQLQTWVRFGARLSSIERRSRVRLRQRHGRTRRGRAHPARRLIELFKREHRDRLGGALRRGRHLAARTPGRHPLSSVSTAPASAARPSAPRGPAPALSAWLKP